MDNIVNYKKISNLCDLFIFQVKNNPNREFLFERVNDNWVGINFYELNIRITKIVSFLLEKKIVKNERVMLISDNRIEWFIFDMAILMTGAISVPSFSTNNNDDNEFIIKDCNPKFIIIENIKLYKKNQNVLEKFKSKIILIDDHEDFESLKKIENKTAIRKTKNLININKNDICSIIYTSGTSGIPKGVVLKHKSILHNLIASKDLLEKLKIENERFLSFLPLSHSYERMAGLYFPLSIGAQVFYCKNLDSINKDFLDVKPSIVTAVPRLYENIYKKIIKAINRSNNFKKSIFYKAVQLSKKKKFRKLNLFEKSLDLLVEILVRKGVRKIFGGKLKTFISGGAALNPNIGNFFLDMGCNILQGYGQTEAGPLISCNKVENNDPTTVGNPVKDVSIKISKTGEILVKGKNVMECYWNNSNLTKETIINGWLHTGDIGHLDGNGRLIISGRKKDIIVTSGGDNIAPQKIEGLINSINEIIQCVVFGNSKPFLIAIVVINDRIKKIKIKEKVLEINKKLNKPEKIRKILFIKDEFTYSNGLLTQTLKIKRSKVYEKYRSSIERLY